MKGDQNGVERTHLAPDFQKIRDSKSRAAAIAMAMHQTNDESVGKLLDPSPHFYQLFNFNLVFLKRNSMMHEFDSFYGFEVKILALISLFENKNSLVYDVSDLGCNVLIIPSGFPYQHMRSWIMYPMYREVLPSTLRCNLPLKLGKRIATILNK